MLAERGKNRALVHGARALLVLGGILTPFQAFAEEPAAKRCLAEAVYFEARDQGWRGMVAVGVVIKNRVKAAAYPDDICSVVQQGRRRNGKLVRHRCQFSYFCDGKHERPSEKRAWSLAVDIAALLITTEVEITGIEGATHYHAATIQPSWATGLKKRQRIGGHVFYAPLP